MKCPSCQSELPADTKFCPYCGTSLNAPATETPQRLLQIAQGYTGNLAAARKLAAGCRTVTEVRKASVDWIRSRDPDLFSDVLEPEEGKEELRETEDLERELIPLDYEERIAVLMHVTEKCTDAQIAEELGISESYVRALLQSAWARNYPAGKQSGEAALPERTLPVKVPENKVRSFLIKAGLVFSAVLILVLAIFIGFRRSGRRAYNEAQEALEVNDYDTAVPDLRKAVRYGIGGDETIRELADAMYAAGDYASAAVRYEDYYEKNPTDYAASRISSCYEILADRYLDQGNVRMALEYLRDDRNMTHSSYADIRINAIMAGGTYTDENGTVWDSYGHPAEMVCRIGDEEFRLELQYDENGHWKMIKAAEEGSPKKTVFGSFAFEGNTEYEVSFAREKDLYYLVKGTSYNDRGEISAVRTDSDMQVARREYAYTYNEDGTPAECEITDTDTGGVTEVTYTYENGVLSALYEMTDGSLRVTRYTYDEDGRVTEAETRANVFNKALYVTYAYDSQGRLLRVAEERSDKEAAGVPGGTYRIFEYGYQAGRIADARVTDGQGRIIGYGIYVPDNGMLYVYDCR